RRTTDLCLPKSGTINCAGRSGESSRALLSTVTTLPRSASPRNSSCRSSPGRNTAACRSVPESARPERAHQEKNMAAMNTYDAIVVGSGITGGWAAKELTEKGLSTLVLEAGRSIVPERDYVEHVPVWELRYRDWDRRAERAKTQPIQRECYYACDEYSHQ